MGLQISVSLTPGVWMKPFQWVRKTKISWTKSCVACPVTYSIQQMMSESLPIKNFFQTIYQKVIFQLLNSIAMECIVGYIFSWKNFQGQEMRKPMRLLEVRLSTCWSDWITRNQWLWPWRALKSSLDNRGPLSLSTFILWFEDEHVELIHVIVEVIKGFILPVERKSIE